MQDAILAIAQQDPAVQKANGVLTIHMGPREIVAGIERRVRGPSDGAAKSKSACSASKTA